VNYELREHVTRVGFNLTLTKTQIAVMVYLDVMAKAKLDRSYYHHDRPKTSMAIPTMVDRTFVPAIMGCERRGFITHHPPVRYSITTDKARQPIYRTYRFTKAGRLMLALLKESGVYDDYSTSLTEFFVTPRLAK
jgi:hypothetical protein